MDDLIAFRLLEGNPQVISSNMEYGGAKFMHGQERVVVVVAVL